jgi:tripartite-type tricarboxylate transporter receptor subunit TctC
MARATVRGRDGMSELRNARLLHWLALAALLFGASGAGAETYPASSLTILVPYAPGGSADIVARIIGAKLQDWLERPVIVENRPGGSELAAAEALARSPSDGSTVAILSNALAINETLVPSRRYNAAQDFIGVTRLIELPFALMVHPSVPAKTVSEFVALAKANPGKFNYGHLGPGSPHFFTMEWFKRAAGIDLVAIPYRGAAPAYAALVAGEVQIIASGLGAATPFLESGQARPLAAMSSKRPSALPDLPTIAEAGYSDFDLMSWMGVFVRSGTSQNVVDRLEAEFLRALDSPDVSDQLAKLSLERSPMRTDDFSHFFLHEIENWAKIVKATGTGVQ